MSTLLLRLAAPLQSWGSNSKFDNRYTDPAPTKSGVIGMLACALGIDREEPLGWLESVKYGVRIDQPGELLVDFHMVHEQTESKNASVWVTRRHYLTDAVFVVGIEADEDKLEQLANALRTPMHPIYLGRRSCPPAGEVVLGISPGSLKECLTQEIYHGGNSHLYKMKRQGRLAMVEILCDAEPEEDGYTAQDVPLSFSQVHRQYGFRRVMRSRVPLADISAVFRKLLGEVETEHNPMAFFDKQGE